jgi:hypothetical protein
MSRCNNYINDISKRLRNKRNVWIQFMRRLSTTLKTVDNMLVSI